MGEFHDAVTTLLEAFARGIAVIKRKKEFDSTHEVADRYLSKSFRKSRSEIRDTYKQDLARHGPGYAIGDEEARTSLAAILFRLNAGFVSVIERFTRGGRSTKTDYTALMNLSNASRLEAIQTFSRLSQRLSKSSLALVPSQKHAPHKRKRSKSSAAPVFASADKVKHSRSKSTDDVEINATGWVRPKSGRKTTSSSLTSSSSSPHSKKSPGGTKNAFSSTPPRVSKDSHPNTASATTPILPITRISSRSISRSKLPPTPPPIECKSERPEKRKSIMSFASDSTKLGEIPEHKWARPAGVADSAFPSRTYYPLEPYQEPEKQRSRLRKLFRRL